MKKLMSVLLIIAMLLGISAYAGIDFNQQAPEDEQSEAGAEKTDGWWNILLLGCDSYSVNSYSRSDSMIIVSINQESGQVKLTSLMRDTWIKVPGYKTSHRKLTELCAVGGPALTIRAINESFGMDISDYALISMDGIATIIDLMGGVDLDVTREERDALNRGLFDLSEAENSGHMTKLQEFGEQIHMNGNQATAFARIRKIDSDYVRTERQRTVLMKIAGKIADGTSAVTLLSVVNTLMNYVDTNLSFSEIMTIGYLGLKLDLSSVEELRLPADGTFNSGTFDGVWCIKPNFSKNAAILKEFIYG